METQSRIRQLNDAFRMSPERGRFVITRGIAALPVEEQERIMERVRTFSEFTQDNNPFGEHDFGSFDHNGKLIFWKIDCYDLDCNMGSPNPDDPSVTTRILTVMLADEY